MDSISIKRSITVRAVVTPSWKEEAERELSNAISAIDQQLGELEKEGQQIVDGIRRQSANPLDPRVQEQVAQVQNQVASKRSEFEEQKRNLLSQQSQVRELEMEQIVEQGQIDSFCDLKVGQEEHKKEELWDMHWLNLQLLRQAVLKIQNLLRDIAQTKILMILL